MLTLLWRFVQTVSPKINPNPKSNHNFKANYVVMPNHNKIMPKSIYKQNINKVFASSLFTSTPG